MVNKRWCWIAIILVLVILVTGCSFTTNSFNSTGSATMKAEDQVTKMVVALASGDADAALALMHPNRKENSRIGIQQMIEILDGQKAAKLELQSVNVTTRAGTGGEARQETGTFRLELEDGTVLFISATHFRDKTGEGFVSFQLVMGVI